MECLEKHGILPGYKGYDYLVYLLENLSKDVSSTQIIKAYHEVAEDFNVSYSSVERSIRYAIQKSDLRDYKHKVALAMLQREYKNTELLHKLEKPLSYNIIDKNYLQNNYNLL